MPDRPLSFTPLFMERIWGGRRLDEVYAKGLPPDRPIGESWEIVDRPEAQSVVAEGPLAGTTLHELWTGRREAVFGARAVALGDRFPILVKLLDAVEALSVQVHPPAPVAERLGGESKNEMWFIALADPGAHLFVGLRAGVTREAFTAALDAGEDVSGMLHRVDVQAGDAICIPSGRVHAIGAGCLIVEVQQNSDTTYRVFDFNRRGPDGRERELHVAEALAAIDFADVEPEVSRDVDGPIADNSCFAVTRNALTGPSVLSDPGECAIVTVVDGSVTCGGATFPAGRSFLVPADGGPQLPVAPADDRATVLVTELPR